MRVEQLYDLLTDDAKKSAVREIHAVLTARAKHVSQEYVRQVLSAARSHPCGADIARAVAGHFTGQIGLKLAPEEVTGCRADPA